MANLNPDDLRTLPRRDLQGLAKAHSLKANGSSNKIIEALCDRFPDGVPPLKRSASPTTTTSRTETARSDRRLSRRTKPQSPEHSDVTHESQRPSVSPSRSPRLATATLSKFDTEKLLVLDGSGPGALAGHQPLRREDALVLEENEKLMREMMEELQEARAMRRRLASENAILRARAEASSRSNALQLGEETLTEPSSSQATEPIAGPANSLANAAGQPMTPASLRQPHTRLPYIKVKYPQRPDVAPVDAPVEENAASSPSHSLSPPPRPSSPTGLPGLSSMLERVEFLDRWRKYTGAQIGIKQAQIDAGRSMVNDLPVDEQRLADAQKAMDDANQMLDNSVFDFGRFILEDMAPMLKDAEERDHGELDWNLGLGTYPRMELSEEEQKGTIRFRNWAVRKDEITLPLVRGPMPRWYEPMAQMQDADSEYVPPEDEDEEYDATSDATPSELEDVEMQDIDMSVEDDLVVGVDGEGLDALLSETGAILRGALPGHNVKQTRAMIPDPQGLVRLPQGRQTQVCWVPIKEKEKVWVRCDQDVCTHGIVAPEEQSGEGAQGEDQPQGGSIGPCHAFDDLPEVRGKPKPKGRWVERDLDLLEGGKYVDFCVKEMDVDMPGLHGEAWTKVAGWKMRLEKIPIWEY